MPTATRVAEPDVIVLRDSDEARRFLVQGLWWQRVLAPAAAHVRPALEWAMEVAAGDHPLPPVGFLADLGHVAFGDEWAQRTKREPIAIPHLPINVVRTYEDHVLGKVYADWTFSRASDALRHYAGRDRARGLAFVVNQFRERAGFPGVHLSPGVIKAALESTPEEILNEGFESLRTDDCMEELRDLYGGLIAGARRTAEILGPEDVFELEHRTALDPLGQRLALRQVLRAANLLEATLPKHRVQPLATRMEVPTRILDEDQYPVGGFTSISNRGSIESLLHSQLAYMESEESERPDLFDIKFLRDELLYYSRDENQFLRRRRTFVFVLQPDLVATRFKDKDLPYQRIVLLLALMKVIVEKLSEWLSSDALLFRLFFVVDGGNSPLGQEHDLLRTLLREPLVNKTAKFQEIRAGEIAGLCESWSHRSMVRCLVVGTNPEALEAQDTAVTRLALEGPRPALADADEELERIDSDDPLESWAFALEDVLQRWV